MSPGPSPGPPPEPPAVEQSQKGSDAPIVDMRGAFDRKTPQTEEDRAQARAFIQGKIDMIRKDPHLTPEQKAAAIADLEGRL